MRELHRGRRALALAKLAIRLSGATWRVRPDAGIAIGDAAMRLDRARLDEHDAGAALRELAEMHEMPIGDEAVLGRILAHGRDHDAVLEGELAQLDRREEHGLGHRGSLVQWARVSAAKSLTRRAAIASRMPLISS